MITMPASLEASKSLGVREIFQYTGPTCEIKAGDVLLAVAGGFFENNIIKCWLVSEPEIFIYKKTFASGVKKFFQLVQRQEPEAEFLVCTNQDPSYNRFIQWLGFKFRNTEFNEHLGKVNVYGYKSCSS